MLVDGERFLPEDWIGFSPDDLLGDGLPLLPTNPPRRVAILRCSCGDPGCHSLDALVREDRGVVIWSDFRSVVGGYEGPVAPAEDMDGTDLGMRRIVFDSGQYRAEVERAVDTVSQKRRSTAHPITDQPGPPAR